MKKIKKIRELKPRIKEIDSYPESAKTSSKLESEVIESDEFEKQEAISDLSSSSRIITPIIAASQSEDSQERQIPQQRQRTVREITPNISSSQEESQFYHTSKLASSKQELQRNYTQTSAWSPSRNPREEVRSLQNSQQADSNQVNLLRQKETDSETSYADIKEQIEDKRKTGRRPWE